MRTQLLFGLALVLLCGWANGAPAKSKDLNLEKIKRILALMIEREGDEQEPAVKPGEEEAEVEVPAVKEPEVEEPAGEEKEKDKGKKRKEILKQLKDTVEEAVKNAFHDILEHKPEGEGGEGGEGDEGEGDEEGGEGDEEGGEGDEEEGDDEEEEEDDEEEDEEKAPEEAPTKKGHTYRHH